MKNLSEPPIGILLTMGQKVIDANGGIRPFQEHFTNCVNNGGLWLQKSRAAPQHDIAHIYLVCENSIWGRVYYGGYCKEINKTVFMLDGEERRFPWPHMMLAGPMDMPPHDIPMRGFQGFRYVYKNLW